MRRKLILMGGLALALGLAAGVALADEPARGSWYGKLWPWGSAPAAKDEAKKDEAKKDETKKDEKAKPAVAPAVLRSLADANYWRRVDVCFKLRDIAEETSDADLRRRADQLEQRAWETYQQQLARIAGGGSLDDATLESHLGPTTDDGKALLNPAAKGKSAGKAPVAWEGGR